MGLGTLSTALDGTTIPASDHNQLVTALIQDFVPRNASGVVAYVPGALGTSSFQWLAAYIASGYFSCGDLKAHHSFNGAAPVGHGWMLCDGRQVTLANYETEHGSGTWATYVGTSPLLNLHLPDLTGNKYLAGAASTSQTGASAITSVGNAGSSASLSHTHLQTDHSHVWWIMNGSTVTDNSRLSGSPGTADNLAQANGGSAGALGLAVTGKNGNYAVDASGAFSFSTAGQTGAPINTGSGLGATDIRPESIEVMFYMRII
jgi:hypothetical protein